MQFVSRRRCTRRASSPIRDSARFALLDMMEEHEAFHARGVLSLLEELPELKESSVSFSDGDCILEEGRNNDRLYILLEGVARLSKRDECNYFVNLDTFSAGALLGLTSFWTRSPVFARITAEGDVKCISICLDQFERLNAEHPGFARTMQGLFVKNLSDRYRHAIRSNVERESLSRQLKKERNQLQETLTRLEQMTNRLLNQEKLATMGQLLAGIAHEINNPVGALLRGIEKASEALSETFQPDAGGELDAALLAEGLKSPFWSSEEKRSRMDALMKQYPKIGRPLARRLAQLTGVARNLLEAKIGKKGQAGTLSRLLFVYELGTCFRAVRISASRIENIVTGLKNYGRQTVGGWVDADIVQGIRDTLTVLNNRLKSYELKLDLDEVGIFNCNLGEINQVWTNLLVNAMDATEPGGLILISVKRWSGELVIRIEDSGTGIPGDKLETVFKPNYTSKNQSGSYGLGLGLSLSRDIVEKHGGALAARNRETGGAILEARFPVSD